jgi:hypothetical protein
MSTIRLGRRPGLHLSRRAHQGSKGTLMEQTRDQPTRWHDTFVPDGDDIPAAALGAGGIAVFVVGAARGSRFLRAAGLVATVAACGLYARRKREARRAKMDAAESHIRSELDDLDPVARAQVLADIARSGLQGST